MMRNFITCTLHQTLLLGDQIKQNEIGGNVARVKDTRNEYSILVGNSEGKRPLVRSRSKWKDIRIDLRESGWEVVDWLHLAQDRDQWR
jgi:hypothetical protein